MLETEFILAARLEDLRGSRQPTAIYPSRQEAIRRRRLTAARAGISADRILDLLTLLGNVTARTRVGALRAAGAMNRAPTVAARTRGAPTA